ncbi:MAG TPA: DUF885 domain-containing protein, partial [Burkholderiales bacterium]
NGHHQYDAQFANDLTEEHRSAVRAWCTTYEERVRAFDRAQLNAGDQLSYDLFLYNARRCRDNLAIDFHLMPIDQGGYSLIVTFPIWGSGKGPQPFRNLGDYDNFLKRIAGFVEWMDTAVANMRRGMARGLVQPREAMESVLPQLEAMIVDEPKKSVFYQPIAALPAELPAAERERLVAAYEAAIREQIVPAYRRMHSFIRSEYLQKTRASAGLAGLADGAKLYAHAIRAQTTLELTPADLQAIGRREMAAARERMEKLKKASGFEGSLVEWAQKLRTTRVRYDTAEEVIAAYRAMHEQVYPQLGRLFVRLPRATYDIRPVEAHREDGTTSQYWRAGPGRPAVFYANLRNLKQSGSGASESLFLHETLPGHHLQIALAQETRALPLFRRAGGYGAYVEGWASYAETLGYELGLYRDPYQHMDFLNSELGKAAALVVDVGLHAEGWSLEQAMNFWRENTLSAHLYPEASLERGMRSGVERAMVWPAFGTVYKIGQMKMLELRARAETKLGPRFSLRAFHNQILRDGALPLPILEAKIDRWIEAQNQ